MRTWKFFTDLTHNPVAEADTNRDFHIGEHVTDHKGRVYKINKIVHVYNKPTIIVLVEKDFSPDIQNASQL